MMNGLTKSMAVLAVLLLAACGGGGNSNGNTADGSSAVSLLITDAVSDQYAKVWVTVLKVTASDSNGTPVTLYDNPQGLVVNLSELNGVAALLNTQNLAPGTYSDFQVTLANEVSLVDRSTGQTVLAAFNDAGQPEVVPVQGSITIGSGNGAIAIDFDLKQFRYDGATGLVTPVLVLKSDNGDGRMLRDRLERTYADVEGTVRAVNDGVSFVLQPEHGAATVTVNLLPATTVYDDRDGSLGSDTSALAPGQAVEVYGNYDPVTMIIEAVRIEIKVDVDASPGALPAVATHRAKVEGRVSSYDKTSDILVLDVREAERFVPPATTLEIHGAASAVFTKGSVDLLAAGQHVEVKGVWEDPLFTAVVIEIEGALPARADEARERHFDDRYAEVKGRVERVTGERVTLKVVKREHFDGNASADTLDIDISEAWFKYGAAECLAPGAYIEAKGAVESGVLVAVMVEVESACGASPVIDPVIDPVIGDDSSNDTQGDDSSGDGTAGDDDGTGDAGSSSDDGDGRDRGQRGHAELKGVIQVVDGDLVTVTLFRVEYFRPPTVQVVVDVSKAWYEYGNAADLAVDRVVEVEGRWDGSRVEASRVEFR